MTNRKHYEIQINQCTPFDEGVDIYGGTNHLDLIKTKSKTNLFSELIADYKKDEKWWVMLEISVWYELFPNTDEWDREYLGCFYIDKRFKKHGLVSDDFDKEYLSNVPKYVAKALQKWMST